MDILPKDMMLIFIKIIIISILCDHYIIQCTDTEYHLNEHNPLLGRHPENLEQNVYKVKKDPLEINGDTFFGVTKLLQKLENELETQAKEENDQIIDGVNKLVNKMMQRNVQPETTDKVHNSTIENTTSHPLLLNEKTVRNMKNPERSEFNRNKTVMKIPKNDSIVHLGTSMERESSGEGNPSTVGGEVDTTTVVNQELFHTNTISENSDNISNPLKQGSKSIHVQPTRNKITPSYTHQRDAQKRGIEWFSRRIPRIFSDLQIKSQDNSSLCNLQYILYQTSLKNLNVWAVKMYDASDTTPRGFMVGNSYQLGHFDECIAIREPSHGISGKHCLIETRLKFNKSHHPTDQNQDEAIWNIFDPVDISEHRLPKDSLHLSLCIPSGCTFRDLEQSLRIVVERQHTDVKEWISFRVTPDMCFAENERKISQQLIITCVVFVGFALIVIAVTVFHLLTYEPDIKSLPFFRSALLSFSMVHNFQKLFSGSNEELRFLHGLKFISMCLIIMGHRLFYYFQSPVLDMQNMLQKFLEYDYILVHFNIVDTFLTITGFLTFHTLYTKIKKHGITLIPNAILYRWLRLVPVYAAIIAVLAIIIPNFGNGPVFKLKISREALRCQQNWWTNILFISNYVNTHQSCLIQSWYLSVDFQMFLIGLLLLYVISKNETIGIRLLYACFGMSVVIPFIVTLKGRHWGILKLTTRVLADPIASKYFNEVYSKTHNRASCYFLGMMTSHLCFKLKEKKFQFTTKQLFLNSIVIYILMEGSSFYQWLFYIPDRPYYPLENALYAAINRVMWSAGICAIITEFYITGFGFISPILNHPMYVPLSRLSYCALLIHTQVQLLTIAATRVPEYLTYKKMFWEVGGDIFVTYTTATILYLFVEAPIGNLVDLFLKKERTRTKS
uniref:Nose resistant to fluoxetine protein 6 n=1 Tax=Cacopsylla melanoneura TaxID=428564 RepID=A0A8D8VQF5_9HEMI